jgi:hypothetical protein
MMLEIQVLVDVIVCFVDFGGIVDYHCLIFLFIYYVYRYYFFFIPFRKSLNHCYSCWRMNLIGQNY